MNEINAARRLRVAAAENAEAHKVSGTRAKNEGEGRKIDLSRSMEAVHVFWFKPSSFLSFTISGS